MLTALALVSAAMSAEPLQEHGPAFDIWDWTEPAKDLEMFERWAADLKELGFRRVELSVPWDELEPEPGRYDLSWLEERLSVLERLGLGARLRINSYYGGATPAWYEGDFWHGPDGPARTPVPSITDERFWSHYGPMCARIAALCRGKDVLHNAFIGIHAELKWGMWWHYDPSTMAYWRECVERPRPDWLRAVTPDEVELPPRPPVPGPTAGLPDLDPVNRATIAFREHVWRRAIEKFTAAIRNGDADALISAPLGESYRAGSALMGNLDYWGVTRGANQVVHSYDFSWHANDPAWMAGAAVASFRGITKLPTEFEFTSHGDAIAEGYTLTRLLAIHQQVARQGGVLKMANYSYFDEYLPHEFPAVAALARAEQLVMSREPLVPDYESNQAETVLLFASKWAAYSYRDPGGVEDNWLHEAQFGVWKLLTDLGHPVRIVCEDNLAEDLSGYRMLWVAFSPREVLPEPAKEALDALELPRVADVPRIPPLHDGPPVTASGIEALRVTDPACPAAPLDLSALEETHAFALDAAGKPLAAHRPGHVVLGYPIGVLYHRDPGALRTHQGLAAWAIQQALAGE